MSDIWNDDVDFEDEGDLVKQLRKALRDGKKASEDQAKELAELRKSTRQTNVSSILNGMGLNPKVAKLIPSDVDASEESVKAWVEDFGDVFNLQPAKEEESVTTSAPQGEANLGETEAATWQRIQSQQSRAGVTSPDNETAQMQQLAAAAKAANGNADLYFAMLNGEVPIPTE